MTLDLPPIILLLLHKNKVSHWWVVVTAQGTPHTQPITCDRPVELIPTKTLSHVRRALPNKEAQFTIVVGLDKHEQKETAFYGLGKDAVCGVRVDPTNCLPVASGLH